MDGDLHDFNETGMERGKTQYKKIMPNPEMKKGEDVKINYRETPQYGTEYRWEWRGLKSGWQMYDWVVEKDGAVMSQRIKAWVTKWITKAERKGVIKVLCTPLNKYDPFQDLMERIEREEDWREER